MLGSFPNTNGGLLNTLLLGDLSLLPEPDLLAESTGEQIRGYIKELNKANTVFGARIDSAKAIFLSFYVHSWQQLRHMNNGNPMDQAALIAYIPNINRPTIIASRQDMQIMKNTQKQDTGKITDLMGGTMFVAWLLAFRTVVSGCVGAYCCPIVYLTLPTKFNPVNAIHAAGNRIPKFGPAFNSDNQWLFQLLAPVFTTSIYAHLLARYIAGEHCVEVAFLVNLESSSALSSK